jgi:hypothetical protein
MQGKRPRECRAARTRHDDPHFELRRQWNIFLEAHDRRTPAGGEEARILFFGRDGSCASPAAPGRAGEHQGVPDPRGGHSDRHRWQGAVVSTDRKNDLPPRMARAIVEGSRRRGYRPRDFAKRSPLLPARVAEGHRGWYPASRRLDRLVDIVDEASQTGQPGPCTADARRQSISSMP